MKKLTSPGKLVKVATMYKIVTDLLTEVMHRKVEMGAIKEYKEI